MARELTVSLGGEEITLSATFKASAEIGEKIADPLAIAREASIEAMMGAAGQVYEPKWRFTVQNLPLMLHIGMKAAGDKRTLADVQELVFEAGFIDARAVAMDYLAMIITPRSEELAETGKDAAPGE